MHLNGDASKQCQHQQCASTGDTNIGHATHGLGYLIPDTHPPTQPTVDWTIVYLPYWVWL